MFYLQLSQQSHKFQQNFNNADDQQHRTQHRTHANATTSGSSNSNSSRSLSKNGKTSKNVKANHETAKSAKAKPINGNRKNNNEVLSRTTAKDRALNIIGGISTRTTAVVSRYAPQTYDAVWAIALSLRGAEERWRRNATQHSKLDRFDYTRSDMASEFLQQMGKLDFLGVSVSSLLELNFLICEANK